jgi:O-antigen ligase
VAALSILSFYIFFASLPSEVRNDDVLLAILAGIAFLAASSLALYVLVPSFARMHVWAGAQQVLSGRLSGLAGHPNTIGRLCCFGILVTVNQWSNLNQFGRFAPLLVFALLALTLLLSNSRTSISITLVLLFVYLFARARNLPYILMLFAAAALAFLLLEPYAESLMRMLSRSGDAQEIATGTSRTHIWAVVKMLIAEKPVLGWGYGSSVFIMPQYARFMGHAAPHAHNMFLQLWLTTGLVGMVGFTVALTSRFAIALRNREAFTVVLLLFVVLNGLSESSAFGGVANITTVALCFAATSFTRGRFAETVRSRERPSIAPA